MASGKELWLWQQDMGCELESKENQQNITGGMNIWKALNMHYKELW